MPIERRYITCDACLSGSCELHGPLEYDEVAMEEALRAVPDSDRPQAVQVVAWLESLKELVSKDWHSRPRHRWDGDSPVTCRLEDAEWTLRNLFDIWDLESPTEKTP